MGACPECGKDVETAGDCPACSPSTVLGSYALGEAVERGPHGDLYRGRHLRTGKDVAVRLLPESEPADESVSAAKRLMVLFHPHLAGVLEAGTHHGRAYVVYPDEGGQRLADVSVSLRESVAFLRDAVTAVAYAAGRGLVHPGLDPDNVRVSPNGRVLVVGYERLRSSAAAPYQAPEVRAGRPPDLASNVYSLGALLYLMTAGREPNPDSPEPPSRANPLVPGAVEDLVLQAMDEDPKRRPSPADLVTGLSHWLEGHGRPATLVVPSPVRRTPWRRAWERLPVRGRMAVAGGASVLLLVATLVLFTGGEEPTEAPEAAAPPPPAVAVRIPDPLPPPLPEPATKPEPQPVTVALVEPVKPPPPAPETPPEPAPPPPEPVKPPAPAPAPAKPAEPPVAVVPVPAPVKPAEPPVAAVPKSPAVEPVKPAVTKAPEPPKPAPPLPAPPAGDRVGTVKRVHPEYGVFVALDAGAKVAVGDRLVVARDGIVLTVTRLSRPEEIYPHGAAVAELSRPGIAEGDVVRRVKP